MDKDDMQPESSKEEKTPLTHRAVESRNRPFIDIYWTLREAKPKTRRLTAGGAPAP